MTYRKQLIIVVILVCLCLPISALDPEETRVSNIESTPTDRLELMRRIAKYLLELPADILDDGKISNTLHGVFGEPIQNVEDSRSRLLTNIYTSSHISKQVPQNDFSNGFGLVQPGTNAQGWQYVEWLQNGGQKQAQSKGIQPIVTPGKNWKWSGLKFGLPAARRRRYFHAAQMANVNFPVRPPTDDLNVNFPVRPPTDDLNVNFPVRPPTDDLNVNFPVRPPTDDLNVNFPVRPPTDDLNVNFPVRPPTDDLNVNFPVRPPTDDLNVNFPVRPPTDDLNVNFPVRPPTDDLNVNFPVRPPTDDLNVNFPVRPPTDDLNVNFPVRPPTDDLNVNFPVRPPTDDLNVNFPVRPPTDDLNVNFPVRPPTDDLNVNFPDRTPTDDHIPAGNGWLQGIQQNSLESLQFLDFNHLLHFNRCTQIANTIIHEKCPSAHCTPPEDQWSDVVQCWLNARKIVLHPEPMVDASVYPDTEADFIPAKQRQYEENLADAPKALGEADFKEYNSVTEEKLKEMTEDVFADGLSANSQSPDKTDLDESALGSWIPKEGNEGQMDIPDGSQQLQYAQEPEGIWVAKRTMETGAKYKRFLINSRFMGIHRPRGKRAYQGLFDNYSLDKLNPWSISGGRRLETEQRPILDAAEMSTVLDTSKSAFNKDMLREYNEGPLAPRNYNTEFPPSEVAKETNDRIHGQTNFNPTDKKRAVWRALGGYKVGKKSQTNPRTFTVNYALMDSSTNDLDNNVHFNNWDPLAKQTFG